MVKIKNEFVRDNQSVLIASLLILFSWPLSKIPGLDQVFIFSLAMFFILFEIGIDMLVAFVRLVGYVLKRREENLSLAIRSFWHGIIRVWIFSVFLYIFKYTLGN